MIDPVNRPISGEDEVYGDAGAPPTSASSIEERQARIEAARRERNREREALAMVLSTEQGQEVAMAVLEFCRPYQSTLSTDPIQMGAAEGRRSVGLWLIKQISAIDPGTYPNLLMAHAKRQRALASLEAGLRQAGS